MLHAVYQVEFGKITTINTVGASVLRTEVSTGHPYPSSATKNENSCLLGGCFVFPLKKPLNSDIINKNFSIR